jgi:hypothetical protein
MPVYSGNSFIHIENLDLPNRLILKCVDYGNLHSTLYHHFVLAHK